MSEALFVGREREKDLYRKFLLRKTPWVLIITGLGGIGKTTLLRQLAAYTLANQASSRSWVVTLDFADEELRSDPLKVLARLTQDTADYCDTKNELKDEIQQNFDQLEHIQTNRVRAGVNEVEDLALREIRYQMRELATEAFYTQLKTFKLDQLVIMLDTCEWLNEPEGMEVGQWVFNELVPGIRTRLLQRDRQCSIVIASRIPPKLDVINGRDQRNLSLSMLGKAEVDQYLEHKGMQDPDLRQRVYEVTHGHALCISIIGNFWENREEQTQSLSFSDLPALQIEEFSEKALMQFTNERVLKQLKSPYKELTEYGVLLRGFDLPFLRKVFPELFPDAEAFERFNHLIRYPYIEPRGNFRYGFHELLREALSEETQKEEPEAWKLYHKRALDYLTETSPDSPDRYYHLLAYDEKEGLVAWQGAIQEARVNMKRELVGALLQAALDKALKLSPLIHAEIAYEQGRFNYSGVQWEEALKSYQAALASFKETGDLSGQAKVLQAMGDVNRTCGRPDDAKANYQEALIYLQELEDYTGQARSYQAMGDVLLLSNDLDAALECYKQSLDNFRRIDDQAEQAKVLEAIGEVQRYRKELDAALSSYGQALQLYQEENALLKRAKVLKVIGDVQRARKDNDAARQSYEQALTLFGELKEPAEEARVRRALEEMQQPESIPIAYPMQENDEQAGYSDPPTLAVLYESLPESLLAQANYASEIALNGPFGQVMLGSTRVSIGRNPSNHLVLDDPLVSSYHAVIQPSKEGYVLIDSGSRNGTLVNDRRIVTGIPFTLSLGDKILIGNTSFTFESITALDAGDATSENSSQGSIYVAQPITPVEVPAYSNGQPVYQTTIAPPPPAYSPYEATSSSAYAEPPTGYTYPPTLPPPKQRRGWLRGRTIVLIGLAFLLVISGTVFLESVNINHSPAPAPTTPTITTQINAPAATEQALENDIATNTARNNDQATAVTNAIQLIYTQATRGNPVLNDSLSQNSASRWSEFTSSDYGCQFTGGAYHDFISTPQYFNPCFASATNFSNFAFEIQMTIIMGDGGGILIRGNSAKTNYYLFTINLNGDYNLDLYAGNKITTLISDTSTVISGISQQPILITVIAQSSNFYFYINKQYIASVSNSSLSHGQIGVAAVPSHNATEVAFSNAKVWNL